MSMITASKKSWNPKTLFTSVLTGLSIGLPVAFLLPHLVSAAESKPLCIYEGQEYHIESSGSKTVTISSPGLPGRSVDRSEVAMIPKWQIWKY